jgi:hypothetical protein
MARAKLTVLLAIEAGTDPLELPDRAIPHWVFLATSRVPRSTGSHGPPSHLRAPG